MPTAPVVRQRWLATISAARANRISQRRSASAAGRDFISACSKLRLLCVLFFLWVKTTDWISQDCLRLSLNYLVWNAVVFGIFAAAFLLIWILPWFEVGYPLLVVAYLVPLGVYSSFAIRRWKHISGCLRPIICGTCFPMWPGIVGRESFAEKKYDYQKGPPVQFKATAGGGRDGEANIAAGPPFAGLCADQRTGGRYARSPWRFH